MDYKSALDYILSIPMFQDKGESAYNPYLDKITQLSNLIGAPHKSFKSIHIAGTNGKGSVSHLLSATFISAGYKTAIYTSPHLRDFRERIVVDNKMISEEYLTDFITKNQSILDTHKPSFFELTTLIAFSWFAHCKVDIAIIECGLGGRLDATNIIIPLISVITNISFDHTHILGTSLSEIASEKSGIIKNNIPTILGESNLAYLPVIASKAHKMNSVLTVASEKYSVVDTKNSDKGQLLTIKSKNDNTILDLETNLRGIYQQKNILTALSVLDIIVEHKLFDINKNHIKDGFINVTIKGRWQQLSTQPLIICDTGHNKAGIEYVVKQISSTPYKQLFMVIGFVADKDIDTILSLLPKDAYYIFTQSSVVRALDYQKLAQKAAELGLKGEGSPDVNKAIEKAQKMACIEDMIFIGGSTFTVAELF